MKLFHRSRIFPAITAKGESAALRQWGTGGIEPREMRMANPSQNSIDYYRAREQHEIGLAHSASSEAIRTIHLEMAESYRAMVEKLEAAFGVQHDASVPFSEQRARVG